jgi:hypothetical protein
MRIRTESTNSITKLAHIALIAVATVNTVALGGLVVSVLATGPKFRGFDPDRGRWLFKGDK